MFKKPFVLKGHSLVSGVDRKKLRKNLEKQLKLDTEEGLEWLEQLVPAKGGELEVAKLPSPSRGAVYLLDKVPILIDHTGKGDMMPSVFGLWRAPRLLPQLFLKHPDVSHFVLKGADVMLPGVDTSPGALPFFGAGALVSISVPGNPAPIAVGVTQLSSEQAEERVAGSAGRGKLVEVVQVYGDHLWADLGGKAVPNEGFLQGRVLPLGGDPHEGGALGSGGEGDLGEGALGDAGDEAGGDGAAAGQEPEGGAEGDGEGGDGGDAAAVTNALRQLSAETPDGGEADATAAAPPPEGGGGGGAAAGEGAQDMDAALEAALLQALHHIKDKQHLPLTSSLLWTQHMLPLRAAGSNLDVKQSRHKKMSKWLQHYAKAGLLTVKEDRHSGDTVITAIKRQHQLYRSFQASPAGTDAAAAAADSAAAAAAARDGGATEAAAAAPSHGQLEMVEVYRPSGNEVKALFKAAGLASDGRYSAQQVGEAVEAYMHQEQLSVSGGTVTLDPTLCDALYKGAIKRGDAYPTHIAHAEVAQALLKRMKLEVLIRRGAQETVHKVAPPQVHISSERRAGSKRVTRVSGLEPFLVSPEALAAECSVKFATASSLADAPGKGAGREVVLAGDVVAKVTDLLMSAYGIPKRCFLVKTGK